MRALLVIGFAAAAGIGVYFLTRKPLPKGSVSVSEYVDGVLIEYPLIEEFEQPTFEVDEFNIWDDIVNTAADVSNWFHPRGAKYKPMFDAAESKYKIPNGLLFRQAYEESRFREDIITGKVRSSAGAVGIMQIIPKWHPEIGEAGALDPAKAIPYAGKYLASLKKQFGSWRLALAAYNWGPGNVSKYSADKWPAETRNYVAKITADVQVLA